MFCPVHLMCVQQQHMPGRLTDSGECT